MFNRREFIQTGGAAAVGGQIALASRTAVAADKPARKRLAIISTVWRYLSHAQHIGDRFLVGYPR
ncbi:MAG: hypothetical protein QF805_24265, partial [Pirellulaceae bacterium]|nr:hypothetical protein [Pirellulaceae bacterium]